jgi:glycosyltransferase involved in cell wall biosynthesis
MRRLVLASPLGGPGETVVSGETGWLVPAGDSEAWSGAIAAALTTSLETRERMGRAARDHIVQGFSLSAMTAATFRVYRGLLEAKT